MKFADSEGKWGFLFTLSPERVSATSQLLHR
nr:MAG TPA: hypothetical protein [Bacteriophage sp.]